MAVALTMRRRLPVRVGAGLVLGASGLVLVVTVLVITTTPSWSVGLLAVAGVLLCGPACISAIGALRSRVRVGSTEIEIRDGLEPAQTVPLAEIRGVAYLPGSELLDREDGGLVLVVGDQGLVRLPFGHSFWRRTVPGRARDRQLRRAEALTSAVPNEVASPADIEDDARQRHRTWVFSDQLQRRRRHLISTLPLAVAFAFGCWGVAVDMLGEGRTTAGVLTIALGLFFPVLWFVRARRLDGSPDAADGSTRSPSAELEETVVLSVPGWMLATGLACTAMGATIAAVGGVTAPGGTRVLAVLIGATFAILGLVIVVAFFRERHDVSSAGMAVGRLLREPVRFEWPHVTRVRFSRYLQWFALDLNAGATVHVPLYLNDLPAWSERVLREIDADRLDDTARQLLEFVAGRTPLPP